MENHGFSFNTIVEFSQFALSGYATHVSGFVTSCSVHAFDWCRWLDVMCLLYYDVVEGVQGTFNVQPNLGGNMFASTALI